MLIIKTITITIISNYFISIQWGLTPLHWACINGHTDVATLLFDLGAVLSPAKVININP